MKVTVVNGARGIVCLVGLVVAAGAAFADERARETTHIQPTASSAWSRAATKYGFEEVDLYAIALQESRRHRSDGLVRPWPWTLHSPETGALYFDTYEAALEKLMSLLAEGKTNIDVGVMQINWGWNGHRVSDPKRLLLPAENIEIAAQILRENLDRYGDQGLAIARYHSARAERGRAYAASVLAILEYLRHAKWVQLALAE